MMIEDKINSIIGRSLSEEASLEELLFLDDWLNEDEKNREIFFKIKSYWLQNEEENYSALMSLSAKKLQEKIKSIDRRNHRRKRLFVSVLSLAAVLVLFFVGSFFIHSIIEPPIEYYTHISSDQPTAFELPDGTKINLNRNSELCFSNQYGKKNRSVKIKGEVFFEVVKDSLIPFVVELNEVAIVVVGTSFNLELIEDKMVLATLVEGSICFRANGNQTFLAPNQQLRFCHLTNSIDIKDVDTNFYTSWKDKKRTYKSIPLERLIIELEKTYAVDIDILNKEALDKGLIVSGSFGSDQSLDQVLTIISHSLPVEWGRINEKYQIRIITNN